MQRITLLRAWVVLLLWREHSAVPNFHATSICDTGSFFNQKTSECQSCTSQCPTPLVRIRACRQDEDATCGLSKDHAIESRRVRLREDVFCPSDAFVERRTGSCRECTRICQPPLVMTSPCKADKDATCGLPVDGEETALPAKIKTSATSRRRKINKHRESRRKRRKHKRNKPKKEVMAVDSIKGQKEGIYYSNNEHSIDSTDYGTNELPQDSSGKTLEPSRLNNSNEYPSSGEGKVPAQKHHLGTASNNSSINRHSGESASAVVNPDALLSNSADTSP